MFLFCPPWHAIYRINTLNQQVTIFLASIRARLRSVKKSDTEFCCSVTVVRAGSNGVLTAWSMGGNASFAVSKNVQMWFCNFLLLCYFWCLFTYKAKKSMSRLTIEVSEQQHQRIKALAALQGQSIKEYALQRLFPLTPDEAQAMQALKSLLEPRIAAALRGEVSEQSLSEIAEGELQSGGAG